MYVSAIHSTHKNAGSPRVSTGLRAGPILRSSLRICGSMLAAERKCREDMEIKGHEVLAPQVLDKSPGLGVCGIENVWEKDVFFGCFAGKMESWLTYVCRLYILYYRVVWK